MLKASGCVDKDVLMTFSEIVVGVDDSRAARAALRWAAQQARITGARLRVVTVVGQPLMTNPRVASQLDAVLDLDRDEVTMSARNAMSRLFDEVDPLPDWTLQFGRGQVGKILVEVAQDAALLVIGRGEGKVQMGSTTHYCLSYAECPVAAVRSALDGTQQPEETQQEPVSTEA